MVLQSVASSCTIIVHGIREGDSFLPGCTFHNPPVALKRGLNCGSQAIVSGIVPCPLLYHTVKYLATFIAVNVAAYKKRALH